MPIAKQIANFKNLVRAVVDNAFSKREQISLFKPSHVLKDNLSGIGVVGKHAALSHRILMGPPIKRSVERGIFHLAHKLNKRDTDSFFEGDLSIKPLPLNLRHKIQWDAKLPKATVPPMTYTQGDPPTPKEGIPMHIAKCPKCNNDCVATSILLFPSNLDKSVRCPKCCKTSGSRHWLCNCGKVWHLCHLHVPNNHTQSVKAIIVRGDVRRRKRPRDKPLSEILDDELARESKAAKKTCPDDNPFAVIEMERPATCSIRSSMLPQSLSDKFPGACM